MIVLNKEQIKKLHSVLIEKTGGIDGIRDEGLLDSSLASPFHTFDGIDLYPTVISKIVQFTKSLVCNHAFIDGNKRIGTYVMLVLLELNNINAQFTDDDIIYMGLQLASGQMTNEQLMDIIVNSIL